jgi:hypothetical protein
LEINVVFGRPFLLEVKLHDSRFPDLVIEALIGFSMMQIRVFSAE